MAVNVQDIAIILCDATTGEIDAINAIIGESCGLVINQVPPGGFGTESDTTNGGDPTGPTITPGH